MTDEAESPEAMPAPSAVAPAPIQIAGEPPPATPALAQQDFTPPAEQAGSDRPELVVAGAFAAGFMIAMILKRLGK